MLATHSLIMIELPGHATKCHERGPKEMMEVREL